MEVFFISVFALYAAGVILLSFGWASMMEKKPLPSSPKSVTILVPFRNESTHLPALLSDLATLNYPVQFLEIMLINDHSDDDSLALAMKASHQHPHFKVFSLEAENGKKAALLKGIEDSNGEIIVTVDADCRVSTDWLTSLTSYFSEAGARMVVGPVCLEGETFFAGLQKMEFSSLLGVTGATAGFGSPALCNGANLAFLRESFSSVGGYSGNDQISSGDDLFLMNKFQKKWRRSVRFAGASEAIVTSVASYSIRSFFQQRLRWAGKWRAGFSWATGALAFFTWTLHLLFLTSVYAWSTDMLTFPLFITLWIVKFFCDVVFLFPVMMFCRIRWRWIYFFALQFVHSFYVVVVGFLSLILKTEWKGRKVVTRSG